MEIISTENLTKKYKNFYALDNISLHVNQGEIYGFLGLNGAGKTTTIRILLGMIKPSSGSYKLFGRDSHPSDLLWNDVGYMVETPLSYPNLTVYENLLIFAKLRNLNISDIDNIINRLHLGIYRNKQAAKLSLGNQQRLGLAKALIHKPKLLVLDEPINGLDPQGIVEVRELLLELAKKGTTIFISSHILSEISRLATRIGIIHEGKLIKELYSSDLEKELIHKLIIDTTNNVSALIALKEKGLEKCSVLNGVIEIFDKSALNAPQEIAALLVKSKFPPKQIFTFIEDLEHYFLRIINAKSN